jgi:ferredoxin
MTIKVHVDADLCEGHGQCVTAAPQVFAMDDDDEQVRVLIAEPPEDLRADVERACALCPTRAITIKS